VKDLVDYYLLRWSFQAQTILTETEFLVALCKSYDNASSAILTLAEIHFIAEDTFANKENRVFTPLSKV
jgi:hypothetical protein